MLNGCERRASGEDTANPTAFLVMLHACSISNTEDCPLFDRYTCSCPEFLKKGACKHVLGFALHKKQIKVPTRFSTAVCGKRKATAGASLSKRGHCLEIDN